MAMTDMDDHRVFQIGELAEEFGLTLRTMRFYEDYGLLKPERDGFARRYKHRDRAKLSLICRAKRLGFTLEEIKQFLELYAIGDHQVGQMQYLLDRARARAVTIEQQIEDGQQTLKELREIEAQIERHLTKQSGPHDTHAGNGKAKGRELP
jgi:DNA-binding transcriptional MerR regulator